MSDFSSSPGMESSRTGVTADQLQPEELRLAHILASLGPFPSGHSARTPNSPGMAASSSVSKPPLPEAAGRPDSPPTIGVGGSAQILPPPAPRTYSTPPALLPDVSQLFHGFPLSLEWMQKYRALGEDLLLRLAQRFGIAISIHSPASLEHAVWIKEVERLAAGAAAAGPPARTIHPSTATVVQNGLPALGHGPKIGGGTPPVEDAEPEDVEQKLQDESPVLYEFEKDTLISSDDTVQTEEQGEAMEGSIKEEQQQQQPQQPRRKVRIKNFGPPPKSLPSPPPPAQTGSGRPSRKRKRNSRQPAASKKRVQQQRRKQQKKSSKADGPGLKQSGEEENVYGSVEVTRSGRVSVPAVPRQADPSEEEYLSGSVRKFVRSRRSKIACVPCRRFKTRCSGERPCARCERMGYTVEICTDPSMDNYSSVRKIDWSNVKKVKAARLSSGAACVQCRAAKAKCCEERPCHRCENLGQACEDPS